MAPVSGRAWELERNDWFDEQYPSVVLVMLGLMADAGLYVESSEGVTPTDACYVFVTAWLRFMERREPAPGFGSDDPVPR